MKTRAGEDLTRQYFKQFFPPLRIQTSTIVDK